MSERIASTFGPVLALAPRTLETRFGAFRCTELRNLDTHRSAFALTRGDVSGEEPLLTRVHSSCVTSEFYGARDCDCAAQLDRALEVIDETGRGALFYLDQEGRGAGLLAKARDRMIVQASRQRTTTFEAYEHMGLRHDLRRYDEVAAGCSLLGIEAPLLLLTNNPDKVESLEREKLRVAGTRPIERAASPFNAHYLNSKRRSGHALAETSAPPVASAELPEPVECVDAEPLPGHPELIRVASYLLPLGGERVQRAERDGVFWMRAHFYADLARACDLVVLTRGLEAGADAVLAIQAEPVLERFPLQQAAARAQWSESLSSIEACGSGAIAFRAHDARGATAQTGAEQGLADLLAYHTRDCRVPERRRSPA